MASHRRLLPRVTFLAALLSVSAACRHAPKPELKTVAIGWRPAGSWSGHGNAQTESFDIQSGQFRIQWDTSHETAPGTGVFRVTVHSAVSGRPMGVVVDNRGVGHDTAYFTDDPRIYHLVIESANVDWSIHVDEAVVGEETVPSGTN